MAVISRALIKGGRAAKSAKDRKEEKARKEAFKQIVLQFPEVFLDLQSNFDVVRNADLSILENSFLMIQNVEKGLLLGKAEPGAQIKNINGTILEQFKWIDTEIFRFTAYPITEKFVNSGMLVRFLIWGKKSLPNPVMLQMFSITNEETLFPENSIADFQLEPEVLLAVDVFISGDTEEDEQNFFLSIFSYIDTITNNSYFIQLRLKANFVKEEMKLENYEDIKTSNFLNLTEQKHVHPKSVKTIVKQQILGEDFSISSGRKSAFAFGVAAIFLSGLLVPMYMFADLGGFFWALFVFYLIFVLAFIAGIIGGISEIKTVKKSRKMTIITRKMKDTKQYHLIDRNWIMDFCKISNNWDYNPELDPVGIEAYTFQQ